VVTETSAGGIVYKKENGNVVWLTVQHRRARHWGFPKGHIGDTVANEQMEDAALREVQEEGGIQAEIVNDTPVSTTYFYKRERVLHKKTVHYFLMEYISGDTRDHDKEISEAKFVDEEELMKTLTYQNDKEAFEKVKQLL